MEVASCSEVVKFEDFIESLYPKPRVVSRPSLLELVSSRLSTCVDLWFYLGGVLGDLLLTGKPLPSCSDPSYISPQHQVLEKNLNPKAYSKSSVPPTSVSFSLKSSSKSIPHPNKIQTGGEDAHFHTSNSCGVFDGVGGWADIGVHDAAAFASGLMTEAKALALSSEALQTTYDPQAALEAAYNKVTCSKIGGSSTALVLTINPLTGFLQASLVGDSIFVVIRRKQIVYRAPIQQHYFNCPYQLGKESDKPTDAWRLEFQLEKDDIVVAASDGFWDNFFEEDIVRSLWVYEWTGAERRVETFSRYLAERAYVNSLRRDSITPFSVASKLAGVNHRGGKVDDISVIVSVVRLQETKP